MNGRRPCSTSRPSIHPSLSRPAQHFQSFAPDHARATPGGRTWIVHGSFLSPFIPPPHLPTHTAAGQRPCVKFSVSVAPEKISIDAMQIRSRKRMLSKSPFQKFPNPARGFFFLSPLPPGLPLLVAASKRILALGPVGPGEGRRGQAEGGE